MRLKSDNARFVLLRAAEVGNGDMATPRCCKPVSFARLILYSVNEDWTAYSSVV